jgi:hypothetical protein
VKQWIRLKAWAMVFSVAISGMTNAGKNQMLIFYNIRCGLPQKNYINSFCIKKSGAVRLACAAIGGTPMALILLGHLRHLGRMQRRLFSSSCPIEK